MTNTTAIAVVTSIPPNLSRQDAGRRIDHHYQKLCIQSWIDCGFRILSVNDRSEVELLSTRYPQVTFIPVERNASHISGRKNPFIADLLSALAKAPESIVGILNSDIVFEPSRSWRTLLLRFAAGAVIVGQRYDTRSLLTGVFRRFPAGFDFFFFERAGIEGLSAEASLYAMGLPWWDYWLPLALAFEGRQIKLIESPSVIHLLHDQAYQWSIWRQLGRQFVAFGASASKNLGRKLPPGFDSVISLCCELSAAEGIRQEETDEQLNRLSLIFVEAMHANSLQDESIERSSSPSPMPDERSEGSDALVAASTLQPGDVLTTANLFRRLPKRMRAGRELHQAILLHKEGRLKEAEQFYRAVLEVAPDEFDALSNLGLILGQQARFPEAITLLRKTCEQQPNSLPMLNALGVALVHMNSHEEAIEYFQRTITVDPLYIVGYYNLGVALHALNRSQEAIAQFEKVIALKPDSADAKYQLQRIRESVRARSQ